MKALIVDYEEVIRYRYGRAFEARGWEVVRASLGPEALELLPTFHPDVILLAAWLPGKMDGFHVLRALKSQSGTAAIPVVILNSMPAAVGDYRAISGRCEFFKSQEVDLVVIKPLLRDPAELFTAVETLLASLAP